VEGIAKAKAEASPRVASQRRSGMGVGGTRRSAPWWMRTTSIYQIIARSQEADRSSGGPIKTRCVRARACLSGRGPASMAAQLRCGRNPREGGGTAIARKIGRARYRVPGAGGLLIQMWNA